MRQSESALERALAEVRARAPEYRHWWVREHWSGSNGPAHPGAQEPVPPWSDHDEERAAQLGEVDPWWMRTLAHELERAHADLRDIGAELTRMADSAIGTSAARRCARLASSSHERAGEAAGLASEIRTAGENAAELLNGVFRRLAAVDPDAHSDGAAGRARAPDSAAGDDRAGGFGGYAAVLRAVRAELSSAVERLPALVGIHPTHRTEPGGWAAHPGAWAPEPGDGPRLPGTDARRVETDTGVRIARLPN